MHKHRCAQKTVFHMRRPSHNSCLQEYALVTVFWDGPSIYMDIRIFIFFPKEANLVEEVEDSPDFWSGPVKSYNSPVEHRFSIGLDWSITGL